jgi:starch synthase
MDHAISRALARFHDPMAWAPRMKTAMRRDFGWERSAERYAEVYRRAANIARTR